MRIPNRRASTGRPLGCLARLALLPIAAVGTIALAQPPSAPPAQSTGPASQMKQQTPMSDQDRTFIQKAAQGGMMQLELSKIAVERTQSPKVKQFALQSVENFAKAGGMLSAMAQSMGMQLPQQPPPEAKKLGHALAADRGKLLDQEYMALIVPASTVAVNLFKSETEGGQNPKLREFASRMLPKLEQHHKMAVQLSENMGARQASRASPSPQGMHR